MSTDLLWIEGLCLLQVLQNLVNSATCAGWVAPCKKTLDCYNTAFMASNISWKYHSFFEPREESEVCWSLQEITSQSWSWGMFADKLPIKISKLRKYWTSFIFLGSCHVEIYCTFAESIYILSVEIIQTSNPIGEDQIYST